MFVLFNSLFAVRGQFYYFADAEADRPANRQLNCPLWTAGARGILCSERFTAPPGDGKRVKKLTV